MKNIVRKIVASIGILFWGLTLFSCVNDSNVGTSNQITTSNSVLNSNTIMNSGSSSSSVHVCDYSLSRTVNATCTEFGYKIYECECGASYREDFESPLEHSYSSWEVVVEPTLSETGIIERTCLNKCSNKESIILPILNSVDYIYEIIEDSTCTDTGSSNYKYTIDGEEFIFNSEIEKKDHLYNNKLTYDSNGHFYICESCNQNVLYSSHNYNSSFVCDDCGFSNHVVYTEKNNICSVTGISNNLLNLIIQDEYNGKKVEVIDSFGTINTDVVHITIPSSINKISASFANMPFLTNVYYQGTINDWCNIDFETLESNPMYFADNFYVQDPNGNIIFNDEKYSLVKDIVLDETVIKLNKYQFAGFENVENIVLSSSLVEVGDKAFFKENQTNTNVYYDGTLENWLNISFKSLESNPVFNAHNIYFYDSNGNVKINDKNYSIIDKLEFNSMVKIGKYQFAGFKNLKDVDISTNISSVGKDAFFGCSNIASIKVNKAVTNIASIFGSPNYKENINYVPHSLNKVTINGWEEIDTYEFYGFSGLETVYISEGTTRINEKAFYKCENLKYISIPNSIERIDDFVFYNCTSLNYYVNENGYYLGNDDNKELILAKVNPEITQFDFCSNTRVILYDAFYGCKNLKSIEIPDEIYNIGPGAFYGCDNLESITLPFLGATRKADNVYDEILAYIFECYGDKVGSIIMHDYSFTNAGYGYSVGYPSNLKKVVVYGADEIDKHAFVECISLEQVIINDDVKSIGFAAFEDCINLKSVKLPSKLEVLGSAAFNNCSSLETISIPNLVTHLKGDTFRDCISIKNIKLPDNLESIGYNTFINCETLADIILPETISIIESSAFSQCEQLTNIVLPASIKKIEKQAFKTILNVYYNGTIEDWCSIEFEYHLSSYYFDIYLLDESGTIIYGNNKYNKLENVEITGNIKTIKEYAFAHSNIKSIIIPEGVTTIEANAFSKCNKLVSVTLPKTLKMLGKDAFYEDIYIKDVYFDGDIKDWCMIENSGFSSIPLTYNNFLYILDEHGDVYNNGNRYSLLPNELIIPDGIVCINDYAFYGQNSIISVFIPDSVEKISFSAFSCCSNIESMTLPFIGESLNSRDNIFFGYIFGANEYKNQDKYIPNKIKSISLTKETEVFDYAFYNCASLTSISLPESLVTIGDYAFDNCSLLTSIILQKELNMFGKSVFAGCENLTDIYYRGTLKNWCNIDFTNFYSNPMSTNSNLYLMDRDGVIEYNGDKYSLLTNELIISDDVTTLKSYSFCGIKFTSIYVPDSVKTISYNAFYGCANVQQISLPFLGSDITHGVKLSYLFDYDDGFDKPRNLKEIEIRNGIIQMGSLSGYSLQRITLPYVGENKYGNGCTFLGYAFSNYWDSNVKNSYVPNCLEEVIVLGGNVIGEYAFQDCSNLKRIILPNTLKTICKNSFVGCEKLEYLEIPFVGTTIDDNSHLGYLFGADTYLKNSSFVPATLKELVLTNCNLISDYAFYECDSIESIVIKNCSPSIGVESFKNLKNLEIFDAREGIKDVGTSAFAGCENLTSINISSDTAMINDYAFLKCNKLVINCFFSEEHATNFDSYWSLGAKEVVFGNTPELEGIRASEETVEVIKGEKLQLVVLPYPASAILGEVTWNSNTPEVATVDNSGVITGISTGNAEIIATCMGFSTVFRIGVIPGLININTLDFKTNFNIYSKDWDNKYIEREITSYALDSNPGINATINFSRVSVQSTNIIDMPIIASKGTSVYVTITSSKPINYIEFKLKEWTTKKYFTTVQIEYLNDIGEWIVVAGYNSTTSANISSIGETIKGYIAESGITSVRLHIVGCSGNGNQQIGLESVSIGVSA